jgi:hypothetical protein
MVLNGESSNKTIVETKFEDDENSTEDFGNQN